VVARITSGAVIVLRFAVVACSYDLDGENTERRGTTSKGD
jgi:hypothetical protein